MAPMKLPPHNHNTNMTVSSFVGAGGNHTHSVGSHTHSYGSNSREHLFMADIAITYQKGGNLRIVKNRYEIPNNHMNVSIQEATGLFSKMLAGIVFKDNDLVMFKEGLRQQIESAIDIAIKTFHESR